MAGTQDQVCVLAGNCLWQRHIAQQATGRTIHLVLPLQSLLGAGGIEPKATVLHERHPKASRKERQVQVCKEYRKL